MAKQYFTKEGEAMGTNFYWKSIPKELKRYKANVEKYIGDCDDTGNVLLHIGKRSSAGLYCHHCGTTLNKHGIDHVHDCDYADWHKRCPICGREGVNTKSFRWTFLGQKWLIVTLAMEGNTEKLFVDEYGKEYTPREFLSEVGTPIEYQTCCAFS